MWKKKTNLKKLIFFYFFEYFLFQKKKPIWIFFSAVVMDLFSEERVATSADGQQSTFFAARKNEVSAIPTVNPAGKTRVPAPWISQDHLTRRFTTIRPALALESPKVWWTSPYKTTARGRSDRKIRQFFRRGAFRKTNHRVAEKKDPMLTSKQTVNNLSKANDM